MRSDADTSHCSATIFEQRAAQARERDDEAQANYELARKQRFSKLKLQMYSYLHGLESSPDRSGKRDATQRFIVQRAA